MISDRKAHEIPLSLEKVPPKESQKFTPIRRSQKRWILVLFISVSTVFGLIGRTPEISLSVSVLAIVAFSLLVCAAHAMDRIAELDMNEKLRKFEEEMKHDR
jgi:hypothetical protein